MVSSLADSDRSTAEKRISVSLRAPYRQMRTHCPQTSTQSASKPIPLATSVQARQAAADADKTMTDPPSDVLERCFEHNHRQTYPTNSVIISAGEQSNTLYYILRGSVSVVIEDEDGHELVLAYLNEGDFFGEIGMFDERHERSAWVRARGECEVAQVSYERIQQLCKDDPDVIFAMLRAISMRVRDTSRKVGDLVFKDVAGRIARALLDLCEQPQAEQCADGVAIKVTRQELARIVGCSREMASRVLKSMEERGNVSVDGRTVIVHRST
jgi:CRP/FNR family cyclic AMP-dependent transcriptional regulator